MHRTNVEGTAKVLAAASKAGVRHFVCASSVGAYSPAPKDQRTKEGWPTGGIKSSHYIADKAEQERLLDRFATENPDIVVARLRPALMFSPGGGSEVGRYVLGRVLPRLVPRKPWLPVLPFPLPVLRAVVEVSWRLRLQVTDGGWVDMAANAPIMDCARAHSLLGWPPKHSSLESLAEMLEGIGAGKGRRGSPPLRPR
ncbi:NAD-dependent epimerase/dehydratase family protein [Paenarthrobacter nicotinovorans]|uniref:NAD-dependent epimerase/dehydratase family protein n=1 Tax=Paenarthrobacter nicotinovorans TaxID=29320 RepID=UPI0038057A9D